MWHGAHIYEAMEETTVRLNWFIQRQDHTDEFLHVRGGRYIEWTKIKADALQFARKVDADKFAEFFFGSVSHGHPIIGISQDEA